MKKNIFNIFLISIFLILLWIPFLDMKFHFSPTLNTEKRNKNKLPALTTTSLSTYVVSFENYFNDNFGFRDYLIHLYNLTEVKILHTSPIPKVILGKNQWLFYNSEAAHDGNSINDFEGKTLFTKTELDTIQNNVQTIKNRLKANNISLIVLIAPSKHTIYPEYLPDTIHQGTLTRYDQILKLLNTSKINTIDSKSILLKAKSDNILYYKTDTHWNSMGAFEIYEALIKESFKNYPQVKPYTKNDYNISITNNRGNGDLAGMLSLSGYFDDVSYIFTMKKIAKTNSTLPTAVIFRDSFFSALEPFMSPNFSKANYLWTDKINFDVIDKAQPNIVIWEMAERYIDRLL